MKAFFAGATATTLFALTACSTLSDMERAQEPIQSDQVATETGELVLVDLVVMNEGHSLSEREEYEAAILPIAERYGMERFGSYEIVQHLNGKAEDAIKLNLWHLPSPEAMQQLGQDADYQALETMRNELHDFNQLTLYTAKSVQETASPNGDLFLVDLVVMSEGYGLSERREYEASILPIAEEYGMQLTHSYETIDYLGGAVEDAVKLNLWSLSTPDAIEQLQSDKEYQALDSRRNEIHDFGELTLYLAKPAE